MDRLGQEWSRVRSSKVAVNAGWMFIGQGVSVICQGVYFVLVARLLGKTEYGIYAGASAMVSILSQYSTLGSPSVFLRYVSAERGQFARYWGNILITSCTLGCIFAGLLAWAGPHWAECYSWKLVLCVGISDCICAQLTMAAGRVFQAFEEMGTTASLNLLTNLLRALSAGVLLWQIHSATSQQWVLAVLFVSLIAVSTALTLVTKRFGRPEFSPPLLRQRTGEGFIFALSYSTTGIYNDIDKAMLGHFGMNAANGVYAMAYKVIDVACTPLASIQAAAFPRFFQKGARGVESSAEFALRIIRRTAPMALVSTAVMLVGAPIIPLLIGKSFGESVQALRWLCLLPVFRSLHSCAGDALTGAGHQKLRLGSQATAAAFNFSSNLYLIPHYGWLGAAWASLATDGMLAAFNWTALFFARSRIRASL